MNSGRVLAMGDADEGFQRFDLRSFSECCCKNRVMRGGRCGPDLCTAFRTRAAYVIGARANVLCSSVSGSLRQDHDMPREKSLADEVVLSLYSTLKLEAIRHSLKQRLMNLQQPKSLPTEIICES
jgi:hypothetical protein